MTGTMAVCATLAAAVYALVVRRAEQRRPVHAAAPEPAVDVPGTAAAA
jgi:hypothetical protein